MIELKYVEDRLCASACMIAEAFRIYTASHNGLFAVGGPHDGSDPWPGDAKDNPYQCLGRGRKGPPTEEQWQRIEELLLQAMEELQEFQKVIQARQWEEE